MDKSEVRKIMTYCFVERGVTVTEERVQVWHDQLQEVPFETGKMAARLLVARLAHPPTVHDFLRAIGEVTAQPDERTQWGEAWDVWRGIAHRHGHMFKGEAFKEYEKKCPIGAKALGSTFDEYFTLEVRDLGTFKAQFRQRYEALIQRSMMGRTIPADLAKAIGYEGLPQRKSIGYRK